MQIEGYAFVNSVTASPRIAAGEGSAVTGRFVTRQVDVIERIEVLGPDGQVETIEGTTIHPIWSEDRQDWGPLGELEEGEHVHQVVAPEVLVYNSFQLRSNDRR